MTKEQCVKSICLLETQLDSLFTEYEKALSISKQHGMKDQSPLRYSLLEDFLKEAKEKTKLILKMFPICSDEKLQQDITLSDCEDVFGNIEFYFRHTLSDFDTVLQLCKCKEYASEFSKFTENFHKVHDQSWLLYPLLKYNKIA